MISLRSTYLSCALSTLSVAPAFCAPVTYADQSAWLNAVTTPTTLTFDGVGSPVGNYSTAAGFTTGLALPDNPTFVGTINGTSGYNLFIQDATLSPYYNFNSGNSLWWSAIAGPVTSSVLHVTFPTPVVAFAVDLMTYGDSGVSYTAKINGGLTYTTNPTQANPNRTFFGFTSDTPINSIDFYLPMSSSGTPLIDNFAYSTSLAASGPGPGDTPELCTFLLIASGLIGMALLAKRFRNPVAQVS